MSVRSLSSSAHGAPPEAPPGAPPKPQTVASKGPGSPLVPGRVHAILVVRSSWITSRSVARARTHSESLSGSCHASQKSGRRVRFVPAPPGARRPDGKGRRGESDAPAWAQGGAAVDPRRSWWYARRKTERGPGPPPTVKVVPSTMGNPVGNGRIDGLPGETRVPIVSIPWGSQGRALRRMTSESVRALVWLGGLPLPSVDISRDRSSLGCTTVGPVPLPLGIVHLRGLPKGHPL